MIDISGPDKHAAVLCIALNKALSRPELLPYLKAQILKNFLEFLDRVTDEEIDAFIREKALRNAQTKEERSRL